MNGVRTGRVSPSLALIINRKETERETAKQPLTLIIKQRNRQKQFNTDEVFQYFCFTAVERKQGDNQTNHKHTKWIERNIKRKTDNKQGEK